MLLAARCRWYVVCMKSRKTRAYRFAVCIKNEVHDLEVRKVYRVLPDESAAKSNYLRVIDDSGEDYLYPARYFVIIEVPKKSARSLKLCC